MSSKVDLVINTMLEKGYPKVFIDSIPEDRIEEIESYPTAEMYRVLVSPAIRQLEDNGFIILNEIFEAYLKGISKPDDIWPYVNFTHTCLKNIKQYLIAEGYSEGVVNQALEGKTVNSLKDGKDYVEGFLKRREEQEANRQKQLAFEKTQDYIGDVNTYLKSKNVSVVHPRELADEFFKSLTTSEKEMYGNNPTYAVHCCPEDKRLSDALSKCVGRFNHSQMVDKVIEDFCQETYPNEKNRAVILDRLAADCPALIKSGDTRTDAYQVIIRLSKQTSTQAEDEGVIERAAANFAAKVSSGESMSVARDTCSTDTQVSNKAVDSLTSNPTKTTEENIKEKQDSDPEWAKAMKAEVESYKKVIEEMQRQIELQSKAINAQQQNMQQQINAQRQQLNYTQPVYPNQQYNYSNQPNGNYIQPRKMPAWLIGVCANLVLMLMVFFIGAVTDISIVLGQIGLLISAIGYPMLGRHKDAKRWLFIGYGSFIIWLMWSILF